MAKLQTPVSRNVFWQCRDATAYPTVPAVRAPVVAPNLEARQVPDPTMWISEADVVSVLDLPGAIAALAAGFAAESAGRTVPLEKTTVSFAAHSTLHALGAAPVDGHLAGTKTWAHTPGGADPVLLLFDAATGRLVAVIEAFALGQLRTAGTAGLATDRLARPDAGRLAIIGTGQQALPQVAAVAAVRPIREVRAFSPSAARRDAFAGRVRTELGLPCAPAGSAAEAADGADIVTLVTRATEPVLTAAMVRPGMHINAIGAIDLARREFQPAILRRATVVTDSPAQARRLSAELRDFFGADPGSWSGLRHLGDVVRQAPDHDKDQVTLYKGLGSGVADLAIGGEVLARVRAAGGGLPVARRGRAVPALTASTDGKLTARGLP